MVICTYWICTGSHSIWGAAASLPIGDEAAAKTYVSMVDKIILIGGQNVDPKYYQEEKAAFDDDFSPERDTFELAIIKEAITLKNQS